MGLASVPAPYIITVHQVLRSLMAGISISSFEHCSFSFWPLSWRWPINPPTLIIWGTTTKKMPAVWEGWLKRPVFSHWRTEHLVQLHAYARNIWFSFMLSIERKITQERTEMATFSNSYEAVDRWGENSFSWDLRIETWWIQTMAIPERDGLQPDYMTLMEKLNPLVFFFFPDRVGSESVWFFSFPIPSGLKFYFYELSKKVQERSCPTKGVSRHRAHSSDHSLNKAPIPWTGPTHPWPGPGGHDKVDSPFWTFTRPLSLI